MPVLNLSCKSSRYEYEIEVLIKAAWNKIPVKSLPVHLYYQEPGTSVSHFRPVRDFLRISMVNGKAAMTRIFFPFLFIDVPGKGFRARFKALVVHELFASTTPFSASLSLALGVCFAILPIYGFQVLTLLALTFFFRINRPLALLGVSVSSPPFLPFWIAASIGTGKALLPDQVKNTVLYWCRSLVPHHFTPHLHFVNIRVVNGFLYFAAGGVVLALLCGILTFFLVYPLFRGFARKKSR